MRELKVMGKDAVLHEKTVQNIEAVTKPRRKKSSPKSKASKVEAIKVDKRVWTTARKLARGDCKKVQVIDFETVVVHNSPHWKK